MIFSTLYNIGMRLASALLPAGKLLGNKARLLIEGQERLNLHELAAWRKSREKIIWFHCASLGEFEQGRPVLEAFREQHPAYGVLLTFFSPSGYEVRKNYPLADFICYLPLDTARGAREFVEAARPDIVVFVKYEFWPNIIREIKRSGARLIGISVILRPGQAFFKPWGGFFRKILQHFDFLFVQNQNSADLLESMGYTRYEVAGDTRFDRVMATARDSSEVPGIRGFINSSGLVQGDNGPGKEDATGPELSPKVPGTQVLVAGSVWPEDMEVLKPFMAAHPEMKFILAPHDIKPEQISRWVQETSGLRYSEIAQYDKQNVLFIDSIGLLARLYKYADYAFVGGGFKTGLHNILEPAVFGVPVFFGDQKYRKFQEAVDLLELGVAFTVPSSLEEVFEGLDTEEIRRKAAIYVNRNAGATDKILHFLNN